MKPCLGFKTYEIKKYVFVCFIKEIGTFVRDQLPMVGNKKYFFALTQSYPTLTISTPCVIFVWIPRPGTWSAFCCKTSKIQIFTKKYTIARRNSCKIRRGAVYFIFLDFFLLSKIKHG